MLTSSDKAIVAPILRSIGALVYLVDILEDGTFRYFAHNLASEADLGIPLSGPIEGHRPEEVLSADHAAQLNHYYRQCVSTRRNVEFEGVRDTSQGCRWANHFLSPIFDLNGNVVRILGTVIEITERRRAEQALAESEARLRALYDDNPAKLLTLDFDGRILSVNKFGAVHVGFEPEQMRGRSCLEFMHPEDRAAAESMLKQIETEPQAVHQAEFRVLHRNGTLLWFSYCARVSTDNTGRKVILVVAEDTSHAHALRDELEHQASHDWLTGLLNRRAFEQHLEKLITATATDVTEHVLCYLDLDRFRLLNDACGHLAGDELLRQLGAMLRAMMHPNDTLARLGGDEFGLLLENCGLAKAEPVANEICLGIEAFEFNWTEQHFHLGASVGLVAITPDAGGVTELLAAADTACYVAKEKGRQRVHIYRPDDVELPRYRQAMRWVIRIKQAMAEKRLRLYAQQIQASVDTGEGECLELLLRLEEEDGTLISAGVFLPAVERYGLATSLDRWVVTHAFHWLAGQASRAKRLSLCALNLSGSSLGDEMFLSFVLDEFDRTGAPADRIAFEITETAAIKDMPRARRFLETLNARGCRFALDDFGAGLSSFSYLKMLPVDLVKIDGSFIRNLNNDPVNITLVRAIVEISRVMGKKTVAESVETAGVADALRELGVDYLQGFGIGLPELLIAALG
jgi:diguanylate cyclase (GGDEF)-like protein/PAS domain S-box-containing protein